MKATFLAATQRLLCLASIGLLLSCASKAPELDQSQTPKVAETILSETLYYRSLFAICTQLGGDSELLALSKEQDWLNLNWKLASAADALYSQHHGDKTFNYDTKPLLPQALLLSQQGYQKAQQELDLEKRTYSNQQKTCAFRLNKMDQINMRLTQNPLIASYEQTILAQAPAHSDEIRNLPSLAGNIAPNLKPGKSYYPIAKKHSNSCPGAKTLVMVNDWPNEVYANFCAAQATELFICEWGNCQARAL